MAISKEQMKDMYVKMRRIRDFESTAARLFAEGKIPGFVHLYLGEEAIAPAVCECLRDDDFITSTHRGHGHIIAKGGDLNLMMAELFGRETGYCKGKGGSMHIASPDINYFATSGILGASSVIANGAALTIKKRNERDRITAVFYGDGASNEGACFEALNLAALWKLPILFVCINNTYGMSTPIAKAMHDTDLSKRAYPFGIPSKTVDGNHVLEVYDAVSEAREYVLENGPMMVVENTYRISGHSKSDGNLYRSKEEINAWKEKCPIKAFRSYLAERRLFTEEELDAAVKEAAAVIDHAVEYGKASKNPSVDDVFDDVYA